MFMRPILSAERSENQKTVGPCHNATPLYRTVKFEIDPLALTGTYSILTLGITRAFRV